MYVGTTCSIKGLPGPFNTILCSKIEIEIEKVQIEKGLNVSCVVKMLDK